VCLAPSPLPLGGDCDPQVGKACPAAGICMDGNCR
jgi:hypothetical protein